MEKHEYRGLTISIETDDDPESPRDWDNLGKLICFHKRYDLGDKHNLRHEDFRGWAELEQHLRRELGAVVVLPLYLYDHSGITISTTPFNCPWDSGQIGFAYVTRETILKEYAAKSVTKALLAKVEKGLRGEVETYDQYLRGEVYGYTVTDRTGEQLDSCWGFYGSDYCLAQAKEAADTYADDHEATLAAINSAGDGI